jgi:hypothetical protein
MKINNERGIALVISLLVMTFLIAFSGIFLLRVSNQRSWIQQEKNLANAFYLAEAGAQAGLVRLHNMINAYLLTAINSADGNTVHASVVQYVNLNNGLALLGDYVKHLGVMQLTIANDYATHTGTPVELNDGQYQYVIRIRQKGSPGLVSDGTWDFYYYFTIDSLGTSGGVSRKVLGSGDFTVRVQKGDFGKQIVFNNPNLNAKSSNLFTASSGDIADKITWQEGQP